MYTNYYIIISIVLKKHLVSPLSCNTIKTLAINPNPVSHKNCPVVYLINIFDLSCLFKGWLSFFPQEFAIQSFHNNFLESIEG